MAEITSLEALRGVYAEPKERARNKELKVLDKYSARLIELSHFMLLNTVDSSGFVDVSPKGGQPGFVKIIDESTLLIPDSSGNNRLDGLRNILSNPKVGLLFMVSGIDEVVRLKGTASIYDDESLKQACPDGNRSPKVVIKIRIENLYFHCAKAVMRGELWSEEFRVERTVLPSLAEILKSQQNLEGEFVSQEEMVDYYKSNL